MLVMKIQGGLGNQMFQWACARALSIKRKKSITLDLSSYIFDKKRRFQLNEFPCIKQIFEDGSISTLNYPHFLSISPIIDDFKTFDFPNSNLYLNGYWQSEIFFSDIEEQIRQDFDLTSFSYVADRFTDLHNCISMHIRRTDYLTTNGYHPVQTLEYYDEALKLCENYSNILIFSDDLAWCQKNINYERTIFVQNCNELETLYLMSKTKYNIIANSSFSWWGAWLNADSKRIIAPSLWFGKNSGLSSENIIPKNWIKL